MTRDELLSAIKDFCDNNTSRQREDLYNHLNETFGLKLTVYDYDGRNDHARFSGDRDGQAWETDYLLKKLAK